MRLLYALLLYLILPVVLLRLWWRGRKAPAYTQRIRERFAFFSVLERRQRIWLHAVSVGEMMAAKPLLQALLKEFPEHAILVTTTTPTGSVQLRKLFPERVEHVYFPYDLPDVMHRFLNRVQPELLIVMETELWPNLYHQCKKRRIPVVLANARLSQRSLSGYQKINWLIRPLFKCITLLSPQSEADAQRFYTLGARREQTQVCGNLKFEFQTAPELEEIGEALRHNIGNRLVWVAASTHKGEDERLLKIHSNIIKMLPTALLILVPRHPERFDAVAEQVITSELSMQRRSEQAVPTADTQVYLGDSMGELMLFYAAADIAFIGGSLVDTGGHNPLEPAAEGVPVIIGPHAFNFTTIVNQMQASRAIKVIETESELEALLMHLFKFPEERAELGTAAKNMVAKNQGATRCLINEIKRMLQHI